MPAGRPSLKTPDRVTKILELAQEGKKQHQIAKIVGVSPHTLRYWKYRDWEFSAALKENKELADDLVEASLFKSATGYDKKISKTVYTESGPVKVEEIKHYPPVPTSMIFWLKNRRKKDWADVQAQTNVQLNVYQSKLQQMSHEELLIEGKKILEANHSGSDEK